MRVLSKALEDALNTGTYRPAFKVLAYDPGLDKMGEVVSGNALQTPLDLTPYIDTVNWTPGQIGFNLADPEMRFHPDMGEHRRHLQDGAIIRLLEGDERVEQDQWVYTFTGLIRGQPGWELNRAAETMMGKIVAYGREHVQSYKRRAIVTQEYTVGSELGAMLRDVCHAFLGLSDAETRIPLNLGAQFMHKSNQLVEVSPWEAVTKLLEVVCEVPFFDGEGKLASYSKNLSRPSDRVLPDWVKIVTYRIPDKTMDLINRVRVIFLDSKLTRVDEPDQCLSTAQVTTGFFTNKVVLETWWSDDHRQRADNTRLVIRKSAQESIARFAFGFDIMKESYRQVDEFHGEITVTVSVFVPILATLALIEYLALAWVPDEVVVTVGAGFTIPVGRAGQAAALVSILLIMMCLGTGQYEVWGEPYDYVYLKKDAIAYVQGLAFYEENPMELENDFIGTMERAVTIAMTELTWQQSIGAPRSLTITNDPALEVGDILDLPDHRRFFVQAMSKTLKRGEVPVMHLEGFKVMRAA
jgi:hypothetical protein